MRTRTGSHEAWGLDLKYIEGKWKVVMYITEERYMYVYGEGEVHLSPKEAREVADLLWRAAATADSGDNPPSEAEDYHRNFDFERAG